MNEEFVQSLLRTFGEESQELLHELETALLAWEKTPADATLLNRVFRAAHTLKGNAGMFGLADVEHCGHDLETMLDRVRRGQQQPDRATINLALAAKDELARLLVPVSGVSAANTASDMTAALERFGQATADAAAGPGLSTLRVAAAKLDHLVDLVGELVTVQARLLERASAQTDSELYGVAEDVSRLTWELREAAFGVRMVQVSSVFARFSRSLRDQAQQLGRDVELTTSGGDTELDKSLIERLHDPLMHLVRNAIAHGIESPHERMRRGKPATGRIQLSASSAGSEVTLTVVDDGAGIDVAVIRANAVARGLIATGAALTDRQVLDLIFLPGFSTASTVTNVSGRGVGLDAVKRAIQEMQGTLEVHTEPGQGTTFSIRVPLTLAIIDGLHVAIGGETYVLPMAAVEECLEARREALDALTGHTLLHVRDETIPFVRLRHFLDIEAPPPPMEQIIVSRIGGTRIGFVVDEVLGERQTVVKPLGRGMHGAAVFSGATLLADGSVGLILDLTRIANHPPAERRSASPGSSQGVIA